MKQNFGVNAKDSVSHLILGKTVKIDSVKIDKYKRVLATITIDEMPLDIILIANGWAWFYTEYKHKKDYTYLQDRAKINKLGLWLYDIDKVCPPSIFTKVSAVNKAKYCKGCNNNN